MGSRRKARLYTLNVMYLVDVCNLSPDEARKIVSVHFNLDKQTSDFANELIDGTVNYKDIIDEKIKQVVKKWRLSRIAPTDRNLLRIATYELLKMPETPVSVIINEAIEIAKKYSTEKSGKFVNGVLDKIKEMVRPETSSIRQA